MKTMTITFLIIIIFIPSLLFSSSSYWIPGLGSVNIISQADAMGRGGTAIGIIDPSMINLANPASLVFLNTASISMHYNQEIIDAKKGTVTGKYNYFNLQNVQFALPIMADKFVVALGITPLTRVDYYAEVDCTLDMGHRYEVSLRNKGSINQAYIAMATKIKQKIFLGMSVNYNFGKIEENWRANYVSDLFVKTSDVYKSTLWGWNVTYGINLLPVKNMVVGAIYQHAINLNRNNSDNYIFGKKSETIHDNLKIPHSMGVGVSYMMKHGVRLSSDFMYRPWQNIETNVVDNRTRDASVAVDIQNGYVFSAGIEKLPTKMYITNYFNKTIYRTGFLYHKLNVTDENGNDVHEYMGMLGFGLPYVGGWGTLDIALGLGKRGNINKNPIEESIIKIMISVNGGEKWFERQTK